MNFNFADAQSMAADEGLDVMLTRLPNRDLEIAKFDPPGQSYLILATENYMAFKNMCLIMKELYLWNEYREYPVLNKTVVDVGAYHGETAIFFMLNGAKNVICYEPYASGELIYANCVINGIKNVKVVRSPILGERGIPFNPDRKNCGATIFERTAQSKSDVSLTLEDIAVQDAVLKMDCEGAEHDIFDKSSRETIRKFSHIMMECHDGIDDIITRLIECGFAIDKSEVGRWRNSWTVAARRV